MQTNVDTREVYVYNTHRKYFGGIMPSTLRKNITLSKVEYETISLFAKKQGLSFSEFLRNTALAAAEKSEEIDLLDFLTKNTKFVSAEEQKEFDEMNIDFNNLEGRELTIDEVLQG